ncbi:hypothetical protein [Mesomycoplasma neurolyticum]|uniref:Uncharacterized protein n=1 Tax=Mesomycoplasma neurolyticum TaxID=2120 RepID=A0A449A595_9BACT|nr:hypothetical protein [Mesomycoplasma neurolyticum]VEU59399.1 Uncharacterised protein [Mesomycoplasma neurolyticum]
MSHIASFTIDNQNESIISCQNIIDKINNVVEKNIFDEEYKELLIEKRTILENKINNSIGKYTQTAGFQLIKEIDTLSKEISHLIWNTAIIDYLNRGAEREKVNLYEYVAKYGFLATEAIENLKNKNQNITKDNLEKEIEIIRHHVVAEEKLFQFKQRIFDYIDNSNINSADLRFELKNKIKNLNTVQEMADATAYVDSKIIEIDKINDLSKNVLTSLKKIEGFIQKKEPTLKFDKEKKHLVKTFYLINKNNNEVQINIKGNMQIFYKLGNYIGHACEKTTEKLLNDLQNLGYVITNFNITREIGISSNFERKMALKLNAKSKG